MSGLRKLLPYPTKTGNASINKCVVYCLPSFPIDQVPRCTRVKFSTQITSAIVNSITAISRCEDVCLLKSSWGSKVIALGNLAKGAQHSQLNLFNWQQPFHQIRHTYLSKITLLRRALSEVSISYLHYQRNA